jgi:DNA-nicking Smr family endonuclease
VAEPSVTVQPDDEDRDEDTENARLFREAVRGVRPLRTHPSPARPPRARPRARFTRADRAAVLRESLEPQGFDPEALTGEALAFHRPQIPAAVLRRLRRGDYRVQREIDLHGMTVVEAKLALREFLLRALEQHVRCVRIVHGKGLGVLKEKLRKWLPLKNEVLAFTQAPAAQGGSGALLLLLKQPPR